jgi:hypothetical protein
MPAPETPAGRSNCRQATVNAVKAGAMVPAQKDAAMVAEVAVVAKAVEAVLKAVMNE